MVCKAADTTHKISDAFGPGTVNEGYSAVRSSRSFAKETRDLKMRCTLVSHQKLITHTHTQKKLITLIESNHQS